MVGSLLDVRFNVGAAGAPGAGSPALAGAAASGSKNHEKLIGGIGMVGLLGGGIAGASLGFFNPGSARTAGCGGIVVLGLLGAVGGAWLLTRAAEFVLDRQS